ncbi:hypothetical protein BT63DRAFT_428238 [Microthyrium microscopicum]|uniref:Uncharacterized protein n=1 Tax=Microthyrium microscopicum TaxID=703497 RepID=A0A6A6U5B4_9PEZI|nr:hypothetical protein BT63DRAFT_428238 [Microthyrium microscopicum]
MFRRLTSSCVDYLYYRSSPSLLDNLYILSVLSISRRYPSNAIGYLLCFTGYLSRSIGLFLHASTNLYF